MYCFKTEETLFEGAVPFSREDQSHRSVLPKQYFSTSVEILQYCRESTTVLPRKYWKTIKS